MESQSEIINSKIIQSHGARIELHLLRIANRAEAKFSVGHWMVSGPAGRYVTDIQSPDGTFGPDGPIVEVTKLNGTSCAVKISNGAVALQIAYTAFDHDNATISRRNQAATGVLTAFSNAEIKFSA